MFAVVAISFAQDVQKSKRSVNHVQVGEQATVAQYAGALNGAHAVHIPQPEVTVVAGHEGVPEQAIQIAKESLPLVQQMIQEPIPIQQPAIQYTQEALPVVQQQAYPIQHGAPQLLPIQYAPQLLPYAAQPVQYAPAAIPLQSVRF